MRIREFISQLEKEQDLAVVDFEVAREQIPFMIKAEEGRRMLETWKERPGMPNS